MRIEDVLWVLVGIGFAMVFVRMWIDYRMKKYIRESMPWLFVARKNVTVKVEEVKLG